MGVSNVQVLLQPVNHINWENTIIISRPYAIALSTTVPISKCYYKPKDCEVDIAKYYFIMSREEQFNTWNVLVYSIFSVDPSRIPKVALLVFPAHCGHLNSNQSNECECIMEYPLSLFNVIKKGHSGYSRWFKFHVLKFMILERIVYLSDGTSRFPNLAMGSLVDAHIFQN